MIVFFVLKCCPYISKTAFAAANAESIAVGKLDAASQGCFLNDSKEDLELSLALLM